MPTQSPTPLSSPPPRPSTDKPVSIAPAVNLGGPQAPSPTAAQNQKKKIMIAAGGALIFLGLVGVVPFLILGSNKQKRATTPTPTAAITPKPSTDPSQTRDQSTRFFLKGARATSTIDLSLATPAGWNASFTTSPSAPSYPWTGSVLITALKSGYSSLSAGNANVSSSNFIAIMDVTDWLKTDQASPALNAAQKQAWSAATGSLTEATIVTSSSLANPVNTTDQGRIKPTYMRTKDDLFKGFAYLTQPNAGRYEPAIVSFLVGKIGDKTLVITARHSIRDKQWSTLSALQASGGGGYTTQRDAALTSFAAGTVDEDTSAMYDEFVKVIQSASFKTVEYIAS